MEERERERTGIRSLKVKYASAFGYAIEVPKAQLANVPPDYTRKQTLANGERYVTAELRELDVAIGSAEARQLRLEQALFAVIALPSIKQRFAENGMHGTLGHEAFAARLKHEFAAWPATIQKLGVTGE